MSEEEKLIIDFLKKCKENKDKVIPLLQQSNEILLNYIDKLNNQLQQKENIIKEVREYLDSIKEKQKVVGVYTKDIHKHILEILDKVEE